MTVWFMLEVAQNRKFSTWEIFFSEELPPGKSSVARAAEIDAAGLTHHPALAFLRNQTMYRTDYSKLVVLKKAPNQKRLRASYKTGIEFAHACEDSITKWRQQIATAFQILESTEAYCQQMSQFLEIQDEALPDMTLEA